MKQPPNKKEKSSVNPIVIGVLLGVSIGIGFLIGRSGIVGGSEEESSFEFLTRFLINIILIGLAYYVQIILHEGGHLIAGLMTGYRFSSFRIGSLMLLKTSKGFSFRRFSLAGTGGQCLLIPPEKLNDGTYSYKLYHMGGVLLNLITAAIFLIVRCLTGSLFCLFLAMTGVFIAVTNGIPMRLNGMPTDGYNVLHIGKESFALDAMWIQLKVNESQTEGIRLKDLPEEWFIIPEGADKTNPIISSVAVFAENRAMDGLDFEKAKALISELEDEEVYKLVGIYQNFLLLDRMTIDLMEKGTEADVSAWNDKRIMAFRKAMARFPSVIRTDFAIRLLKEKDTAAAEKCRELLKKVARRYPTISDIESEEEIMEVISRS